MTSNAKDDEGHTLVKLWTSYRKAADADKPRSEADILAKIKKEASARRLTWDFYDACDKYVDVRSSSNWKLRPDLEKKRKEEIEAFGEPIAVFFVRSSESCESRRAYVEEHKGELQKAHNPEFYMRDGRLGGCNYSKALMQLLGNDYEFVLWSLFLEDGGSGEIAEHYRGQYPCEAFVRYELASRKPESERDKALEAFAVQYQGKAASLLAESDLISSAFTKLRNDKGTSSEFISLRARCQKAIDKGRSFSGSERTIADCCLAPSEIIESLDEKSIDYSVSDDVLTVSLRNLPSARAKIMDGKTTVFDKSIDNPVRSFYVFDTLSVKLPSLPDKDYTVICSNGKYESKGHYIKHTLSIALRRDSEGYAVLVADYKTGEPVKTCTLKLLDRDNKELAAVTDFAIDGFTRLPKAIMDKIPAKDRGCSLRAETIDPDRRSRMSGQRRISPVEVRVSNTTSGEELRRAVVLTDRGAFKPGETVHFKAILYSGDFKYRVCDAGLAVTAELYDPGRQLVDTKDFTTNDFGSIDGDFILKKADRGGRFAIRITAGGCQLASTSVTVDEFVLPTFSLAWSVNDRLYLPGDIFEVGGIVKSYSGHGLSSAKATYSIRSAGTTVEEGDLKLNDDGSFGIAFKSGKTKWGASYVISVKISDGTGETLEFNTSVDISESLRLNAKINNSAKGSFCLKDRTRRGSIVSDDNAVIRLFLDSYGGKVLSYPKLTLTYTIKSGDKAVAAGTVENGRDETVNFSRLPSGLYVLEARAIAVNDDGEVFNSSEGLTFVKVEDDDSALNFDAESFFKEVDGLALQFGASCGPVWAVVELFGDGNILLDKRMEHLDGIKGKAGSLTTIRFERKEGYPEDLSINVFYFHDKQSFEYSRKYSAGRIDCPLPLTFSRFLDTTVPGCSHTFSLKTLAGVECAATVFDISSETINPNKWYAVTTREKIMPSIDYTSTCGVNESNLDYEEAIPFHFHGSARTKGGMVPMLAYSTVDNTVEMSEDIAADDSGQTIAIRENFANTLVWEPFLRPDDDGLVSFSFDTGDKLSTFAVQIFAHDKDFHNSVLRREMLVTLPVKVAFVQPQYLYEGDRYVARVTVSNSLSEAVSGQITVKFLDGTDYKTAKVLQTTGKGVNVPAGGSIGVDCGIAAPGVKNLGLLVSFKADNPEFGSDGAFVTIPVSAPVQTITEAHSALLLASDDRVALIDSLRTLFVNSDGADASIKDISIRGMLTEAIQEKLGTDCKDLLSRSEVLYAALLVSQLHAFNAVASIDASTETIPTVASDTAKQSASAPASVEVIPEEQMEAIISDIVACHNPDGGFAWFAGMNSSPVITAALLERLAKIGDACPQELLALVPDAAKYLDRYFLAGNARPRWCGGLSLEEYLHVRSLFPATGLDKKGVGRKSLASFRKEAKAYLVPSGRRGLDGQVFEKARRMQTLYSLLGSAEGKSLAKSFGISAFTSTRLSKSLDKDIASLLQYAEPHKSGGIYYPNAVMPWRGLLEGELYAHSMICDLLSECGHDEVSEGIRLWMMVQKETQKWDDDPAYIEALGSVLRGSEATLDTRVISLADTTSIPFEDVRPAGNGFRVKALYFLGDKEIADGEVLHVGDKITAKYEIWNEENRSFVRLCAPRNAALRPVHQTSGHYGWWVRPLFVSGWTSFSPQGYRSVLSDRTEYWFDSYPEEKTTISEDLFVTQEGTFRSPVTVIESLYAPHYRANDAGRGTARYMTSRSEDCIQP